MRDAFAVGADPFDGAGVGLFDEGGGLGFEGGETVVAGGGFCAGVDFDAFDLPVVFSSASTM